MMINNNPYNLPERPPNNKNRIYTESTQYRQQPNDLPTPYSQYLARQSHHPSTMNKNSHNIGEDTTFRQQYPNVRNQPKHFLPSPKNLGNNPPSLNNFIPSSPTNRANYIIGSSLEKKQANSLRQSLGVTGFDMSIGSNLNLKQINQKIEAMALSIKSNQKRIVQLQKNATLASISNNSKTNESDPTTLAHNFDISHAFNRYQNESNDKFQSIQAQLQVIREEIKSKNSVKISPDLDKIILDKYKELTQSSKMTQSSSGSLLKNNPEELKKQVEGLRIHLEQKMKKNFDFITGVIGRLERQLENGLIQAQPNFKPSAIKCSTSAILLRFVQCFKVRKHSAKSGQIKITVADNTYYIDAEGYLLDKQQFYIVDSRDCRVRLEEKHIKLLKQQNILQ